MQGLTEGRLVHYVLEGAHGGKHRPAVIVNSWGERNDNLDDSDVVVNLVVLLDGGNDGAPAKYPMLWVTSVHFDESTFADGTWHWIERA